MYRSTCLFKMVVGIAAAGTLIAETAPAGQADMAPMRTFASFIEDAETARGFWAELSSMYASETDFSVDVDVVNTTGVLAYGQEMWEAGMLLPYLWADPEGASSVDGLGDMRLWGKALPLRTDTYQLGGGLVLQVPTGDEDEGLSTDEVGLEPFLTGGASFGSLSTRASLGYGVFPDISDSDTITYSLAGLLPAGDSLVLRAELVGASILEPDLDSVSFVPGVDVRIALDRMELWLRPTVAAGLTDDAPDYQVGLGIALMQAP